MATDRGKLGEFLREVIDWDWAEFCLAEHDDKYTGLEGVVLSLIRTTAKAKLNAIKLAIDRVDGKLETPIKFEYPKVFARFPFAESRALPPPGTETPKELLADLHQLNAPPEPEDAKQASMTIRETLEKLGDSPRKVTPAILAAAEAVEQDPKAWMGRHDGNVENRAPLVKSVIAANLMKLAQDRNFDAINEVFDQIDGKLVETFRVLGEDMYLDSYALEAPYDAIKGKDGVWVRENVELQAQWQSKLEQNLGKKGSN